jgi:putative flippase GtrA
MNDDKRLKKQNLGVDFVIQFTKFSVVGLSNTLIAYITFSFCIFLGLHYIASNLISFIISIINAYYWNNRIVFRQKEKQRNQLITFLKTLMSYASTGLVLSGIILFFLIEKLYISSYIAQLLVLIITVPLNFLLNKFWTFKN